MRSSALAIIRSSISRLTFKLTFVAQWRDLARTHRPRVAGDGADVGRVVARQRSASVGWDQAA